MGQVQSIKCPLEDCKVEIQKEFFIIYLADDEIQKYDKFKQNYELSIDPLVRWCIKPGCETHFKGQDKNIKKIKCNVCSTEQCFQCGAQWHEGKMCEEVIDLNYQQVVKDQYIQKCPFCNAPIQKSDGCNHMTCYKCKYQFCWLCRGKYSKYHYKNWNIFACPGQQNSKDFKQLSYSHRIGKKLIIFLLFLITLTLSLALWPLCLIISGFVLPSQFISTICHDCLNNCKGNLIKQMIYYILVVIFTIISYPFALIFAIVPGTCLFIKEVILH